jgi:hypothetical protein
VKLVEAFFNMQDGEAWKTAIMEAHHKLLIEIKSMNLEMQLQDLERRCPISLIYMHQVLALPNTMSVKQP